MEKENTSPKKVSRRRKKSTPLIVVPITDELIIEEPTESEAFAQEAVEPKAREGIVPATTKVPEVKEAEDKEVDKVIEELFNESVLTPVKPWKKPVRPMPAIDPSAPQRGIRQRFR